jgi:hypothetical protein
VTAIVVVLYLLALGDLTYRTNPICVRSPKVAKASKLSDVTVAFAGIFVTKILPVYMTLK